MENAHAALLKDKNFYSDLRIFLDTLQNYLDGLINGNGLNKAYYEFVDKRSPLFSYLSDKKFFDFFMSTLSLYNSNVALRQADSALVGDEELTEASKRLLAERDAAFVAKKIIAPNTWEGISPSGIKIKGGLSSNGTMTATFYPIQE